jgi:hypothetical protein
LSRKNLFYSQGSFDRTTLHLGQIDKTTSPLTISSGSSAQLQFGHLQIGEYIFFPFPSILFLIFNILSNKEKIFYGKKSFKRFFIFTTAAGLVTLSLTKISFAPAARILSNAQPTSNP